MILKCLKGFLRGLNYCISAITQSHTVNFRELPLLLVVVAITSSRNLPIIIVQGRIAFLEFLGYHRRSFIKHLHFTNLPEISQGVGL